MILDSKIVLTNIDTHSCTLQPFIGCTVFYTNKEHSNIESQEYKALSCINNGKPLKDNLDTSRKYYKMVHTTVSRG